MAGFTDGPTRRIAREYGADLTYTEMISARALVEGHRRTLAMLDGVGQEPWVVVQLMGSDPEVLAEAAAMAESLGAGGIDLNLGCAVRKIVRSGAGAALMREPARVGAIVHRVRNATRVPLSVKMRAGWDANSPGALEIARIAEGNGAEAVAVHGRFAVQGFTGRADWDVVRLLVEVLTVPVIGNGDIGGWREAREVIRRTGCAAVMIGRASLGNPWVFREIRSHGNGGATRDIGAGDRISAARRHLALACEANGRSGLHRMRKHLAWYLRGLPGAREARDRIHRIETLDGVLAELEALEARVRRSPAPAPGPAEASPGSGGKGAPETHPR